jgi:hypothetical protein
MLKCNNFTILYTTSPSYPGPLRGSEDVVKPLNCAKALGTRLAYNLGQNPWDHSSQYYKVIEHWQNKLCLPLPPSSMLWTTPKQLLVIFHDTSSTLSWGSGGLRRETWFNMEFIIKICEFSIWAKIVSTSYVQIVVPGFLAWLNRFWTAGEGLAKLELGLPIKASMKRNS